MLNICWYMPYFFYSGWCRLSLTLFEFHSWNHFFPTLLRCDVLLVATEKILHRLTKLTSADGTVRFFCKFLHNFSSLGSKHDISFMGFQICITKKKHWMKSLYNLWFLAKTTAMGSSCNVILAIYCPHYCLLFVFLLFEHTVIFLKFLANVHKSKSIEFDCIWRENKKYTRNSFYIQNKRESRNTIDGNSVSTCLII